MSTKLTHTQIVILGKIRNGGTLKYSIQNRWWYFEGRSREDSRPINGLIQRGLLIRKPDNTAEITPAGMAAWARSPWLIVGTTVALGIQNVEITDVGRAALGDAKKEAAR